MDLDDIAQEGDAENIVLVKKDTGETSSQSLDTFNSLDIDVKLEIEKVLLSRSACTQKHCIVVTTMIEQIMQFRLNVLSLWCV